MKHDLTITLFLVAVFVLSQLAGLFLINYDAEPSQQIIVENGQNVSVTVVQHEDTALGPRPQTTGIGAVLFILLGVVVGTLLVLIIIKFGKVSIWKSWFFLAVTISITIALGVFLNSWLALLIAVVLAVWKIFRPNVFVHNISEILIYSGIALLIVPMFGAFHSQSFFSHPVFLATILLLIISVYDIIAVWQSRHMVKMAEFQTKSNVFAGLFIPYSSKIKNANKPENKSKLDGEIQLKKADSKIPQLSKQETESKNAILGGGDIAFPLIFSGVVMERLIADGLQKISALGFSLIITLTTTVALFLLLYFSKKDRFYPAMPFISLGCLVGYGIITLLLL